MTLGEARRALDVPPGADEAAITAAFRRRSKLAHPDVGGSHEMQVLLMQARDCLLANRKPVEAAVARPKLEDSDWYFVWRRGSRRPHGEIWSRQVLGCATEVERLVKGMTPTPITAEEAGWAVKALERLYPCRVLQST
jgi:hypothetical protein